jgi:hypothetical protein
LSRHIGRRLAVAEQYADVRRQTTRDSGHDLIHTCETVRPCGYIGEITLYNIDLVNVFAKRELCLVKAANDGGDLKAPIVAEALNELSAGAPSPA